VPDEFPVHVVDERDERRHAVAFALFAGPDATYVAGVYRPSQVELQLAERLLETLEAVGWRVTRLEEEPPELPKLYDQRTGQPIDPKTGYPWEGMGR
jgi:hypothetical protein